MAEGTNIRASRRANHLKLRRIPPAYTAGHHGVMLAGCNSDRPGKYQPFRIDCTADAPLGPFHLHRRHHPAVLLFRAAASPSAPSPRGGEGWGEAETRFFSSSGEGWGEAKRGHKIRSL